MLNRLSRDGDETHQPVASLILLEDEYVVWFLFVEIGKKDYNGEDAATSEDVEVSILTAPYSFI